MIILTHFNPLIVKRIYSLLTTELGMKRITSDGLDCYERNGEYYRLDTFYENDGELLYCIEWAGTFEDAKNNNFEDAFLYSEELGADKIISEMRNDLH